ncbi:unnamed protein product [Parnassius apollo]|uniref:(apollo) hypothetical protein n=1 Tax=Parnassius apollo TaxID=110799 RepID=A0A8S3XVA8_PARAO|nr:unnamed protein product [Parnassius apollo]
MDENQISEEEVMNSILIENNEQETEICLPEKSAQCQAMIYDEVRPISSKRRREEDEEERWITVSRNGKRVGQKVDVYINCFEKLPKQFALAKLLKTNNIKHISHVKYVNAYKVFVQFECAESADELMNCTPLKELGWRFQKPLEVAFSYGVIKDIELEMTEK